MEAACCLWQLIITDVTIFCSMEPNRKVWRMFNKGGGTCSAFCAKEVDCSLGGLVWLFLECGPELVLLGGRANVDIGEGAFPLNLQAKYLTRWSATAQGFPLASSRRSFGVSLVQECRVVLLVRSSRSDCLAKPHCRSFLAGYNVSWRSIRSWIWRRPTMCEMSVLDFCTLVDPLRFIASWGLEEVEIQEESPQDYPRRPDSLAWLLPESRQLSSNYFRYS